MTTVTTVEARNEFAEIVNRAAYGKERITLTRRGKAIAAIVPIEDAELLQALEDRVDLEAVRAALEEAERDGTIPWERLRAELGLDD